MIKETKTTKVLNIIARWFVGLVFLFSSFTKGVDPLGTAYKVEEYMSAWSFGGLSFEWAMPLAPFLSMALITAEFMVGIMMLTGAFRKLGAWLLLLMMVFFTGTTLFDAITNKVSDCGCFGDAVKLTNWQTFWKNVALDVPTVWIFFTRWLRYRRRFERDWIILLAAIAAMVVFAIYNIKHEPVLDFRPWKVGNRMIEEREAMNHMTFKNMASGEEVTVDYPNGSWDQVPAEYKDFDRWEIVSSTSDEPFEVKADGFSMMDVEGEDHSVDLLLSEDGLVVVTVHDLARLEAKDVDEVKSALSQAEEIGTKIVMLTSALPEEVQAWLYENKISGLDYLFADATAIKAIMRGNPGFMYMKDATVLQKTRKADELEIEN